MIKFFRKIRQNLLSEGKTGKYLKYAIGEIVLVVIGILIAIQVNNWNEDRKSQIEASKIRQELKTEFLDNRKVLNERISLLEEANNHVKGVISFMNKDSSELRNTNIDSLIAKSIKYGHFNPTNSTISELISSGKLNLIMDVSLKKNLYKWLGLLEDADEDFKNQDLQGHDLVVNYLYKNISTRNLNTYNNLNFNYKNSELFDGDYYKVFHDSEFESFYFGKLFWNTVMLNHYKELDTLALEIINQSNKE